MKKIFGYIIKGKFIIDLCYAYLFLIEKRKSSIMKKERPNLSPTESLLQVFNYSIWFCFTYCKKKLICRPKEGNLYRASRCT